MAGLSIGPRNLNSFVKSAAASADGRGTTLRVDLDGAGANENIYTLTLQNVLYNPANTQTIFGI